jgi:predicted phosphodiesterase
MPARRAIALLLAAVVVPPACLARVSTVPTPVEVTTPERPSEPPIELPNEKGSLHFAVIGDFGTGEQPSFELAEQVWRLHQRFPLDLVITVGDNLYGGERPQDFKRKFEQPYRPLLDAGVKFHAALGNHDSREQRYYELFNMDGKLYYSFRAPKEKVRFFVLDSTYPTPEQIAWLEKELEGANEPWKIAYFHHPLYSSGDRHGSHVKLRQTLEPLFVEHGVSVVLTGHDHFYERIKPQKGIVHFVAGSGGALRIGNIERDTGLTDKGYDSDRAFMAVEITGDRMFFQAISRTGEIVDSGIIERRKMPGEGDR